MPPDSDGQRIRVPDLRASDARRSFSMALECCAGCLDGALDGSEKAGAMRAHVQALAANAQENSVPPERLLAAFKAMVLALPAVRAMNPAERGEAVSDFTRMAIETYYESRP